MHCAYVVQVEASCWMALLTVWLPGEDKASCTSNNSAQCCSFQLGWFWIGFAYGIEKSSLESTCQLGSSLGALIETLDKLCTYLDYPIIALV